MAHQPPIEEPQINNTGNLCPPRNPWHGKHGMYLDLRCCLQHFSPARETDMFAHVLSDIHLEMDTSATKQRDVTWYFDPGNRADTLFLLGDIGKDDEESYRAFLASCCEKYQKIFLVLGNHEVYGSSFEETVARARELCRDCCSGKLVLLERDTYDLPGLDIRIAGTTLWSHVTEEQMSSIGCFIADFHAIQGWTVAENNRVHASSLQWLAEEALRALADNKKLIVMTHHAPLLRSCHSKHLGSPLSSAFETDLSEFIKANGHIKLWLHGHTHHSDARMVGNALVLSNQYGYAADTDARETFDPMLKIDLAGLVKSPCVSGPLGRANTTSL